MATNVKYQSISVQRTVKTVYELPRENMTEDELAKKSCSGFNSVNSVETKLEIQFQQSTSSNCRVTTSYMAMTVSSVTSFEGKKSTSDSTKRSVSHMPEVTKPAAVVAQKTQQKQTKKAVLKKDETASRVTILESRKSTSDSTRRRVAHEPEVTKTAAEKAQQKQIKKPVLNKDGTVSRVTPFKGRKSTSDSTKRSVSQMPVISKPAAVVAGKPQQKQKKKVLLKKDETVSRGTKFEGKKSTSDSTKRRVALVPEVTKPAAVVAEKAQQNQIKKLVLKKDGSTWSVKPREVKQTTQRVVVDSARAEHSRSSSSGVDDRVKAFKRKPEGLSVEEEFSKKQKKGVDDRVKPDKIKSGGLGVFTFF